ncbi:ornithine cyclodeaminase [Streptomyces sp. TLI_235]|nr:2,3-diaminopropionate biosynthesis protein SbnB [Streptomyces sp. TLI_235]PBC75552.1 ornithine cyclodeaminase [Streptomyces sp. TLI_235]
MLILGRKDVESVLDGREDLILDLVRDAYLVHADGGTALPHSIFLRFPENERDRIIGLPAYLGGRSPVAGFKWVSSFPGNIDSGLERASAVVVLNSLRTGRAEALLDGTVISARRTAASAALAARKLTADGAADGVTLFGCGAINFEVLRFLTAALPELHAVTLFDLDPERAEAFAERVAAAWPGLTVDRAADQDAAMAAQPVVSLATTAARPHLTTDAVRPGGVVLHLSLRDLTVESVLAARNVVDDTDHVSREATSIHLAEQRTGDRAFVHAEIGDLLQEPGRSVDPDRVTVYSPFGLGVLDLALAEAVRAEAARAGLGTAVPGFQG